jgi:hypothetical protein
MRNVLERLMFVLTVSFGLLAMVAALSVHAAEEQASSKFKDPEDGKFDVSGYLDTAYGFLPVLAPITEPAVGYGAAAALLFIDRPESDRQGKGYARPNIGMIGGLATENGTRGLFGAHIGNWKEGRVRTLVGVVDADVNLTFFGLGGDSAASGQGVDYTIKPRGGLAGGSYRLGETPYYLGLRYLMASTEVQLEDPQISIPGLEPRDFDLDLAALTLTATFDTRNNFFTPTHGWYADLSVPFYREGLGGDRDFETLALTGIHYRPWTDSLHFAVRATVKASTDDTPFFLRPFVMLRGVQALRFQGEETAEIETELRWQFRSRYSLVAFGGAGVARSDTLSSDRDESVTAGGVGFRYLAARRHGLHMGLDVAWGPDDPVFYVIVGSAWLRP